MDVSLFDFDLPAERIALRPAEPRDSARMMVVREDGDVAHARIRDLPKFLRAGDLVVVNDSKVVRARLRARRPARGAGDGAAIEILLHKRLAPDRFLVFARPARRLASGDTLNFHGTFVARVAAPRDGGEIELAFDIAGAELDQAISRYGEMPLPPYIANRRAGDARDMTDYQTMFAREDGSVAAPTAGLHFTESLIAALRERGIDLRRVTLHVGPGTFLPVKADDTSGHHMHPEWGNVSTETAAALNATRRAGGRIVAVGSTSLRLIESAAGDDGTLAPFSGETALFITPGYRFRAVDAMLTNFHLPRSTLFMLVCAFCGLDVMRRAYAHAIASGYRFYSYGDACLLFRQDAA